MSQSDVLVLTMCILILDFIVMQYLTYRKLAKLQEVWANGKWDFFTLKMRLGNIASRFSILRKDIIKYIQEDRKWRI